MPFHWKLRRAHHPSCALALALGLALASLSGCNDKPERPRKQQVVSLLPDTPPPPPPPKPEERPPPRPDDKPQPAPQSKADEPPLPQALKTDEAPGAGPGSGLSSGAVTQDYTDQKIGQGQTIGGEQTDSAAVRLAANAYANAATRALNEFLARDRDIKRLDYRVRVQLWLSPAGGLQRAELVGSTGDAQTDEALRAALARFPGTTDPPPGRLPQPLRVLVSNRLLA